MILTAGGAFLVNQFSQEILKLLLVLFLITFSIVSLLRPNLKFKPSVRNTVIGGSLSGFFAGLIGTGGALSAFLTAFNLKKGVYIATATTIALAVDMTRIPIYFSSGLRSNFTTISHYFL